VRVGNSDFIPFFSASREKAEVMKSTAKISFFITTPNGSEQYYNDLEINTRSRLEGSESKNEF